MFIGVCVCVRVIQCVCVSVIECVQCECVIECVQCVWQLIFISATLYRSLCIYIINALVCNHSVSVQPGRCCGQRRLYEEPRWCETTW